MRRGELVAQWEGLICPGGGGSGQLVCMRSPGREGALPETLDL